VLSGTSPAVDDLLAGADERMTDVRRDDPSTVVRCRPILLELGPQPTFGWRHIVALARIIPHEGTADRAGEVLAARPSPERR
jgi:hypothetical protein